MSLDRSKLKFAIVVSRWNELITNALLEGALDELQRAGCPEPHVVKVPGAWEIPLAAKHLIDKGGISGVIALGCIMQGQTTHAQMLSGDTAGALMNLQLSTGVPISYGILTPEDVDQALDRAGLKKGNKGREAAQAAIEMAEVVASLS